jgi:hypothetical protein
MGAKEVMTDDTIENHDLQIEAREAFEAFARRCEGRLNGEVFDSLIALTAHVLNEAAKIIHHDDPDRPVCPVCLAVEAAKIAAHKLAKAEGYIPRVVAGQRSTEGQDRVSNADDIPVAAAPSRSPWRLW